MTDAEGVVVTVGAATVVAAFTLSVITLRWPEISNFFLGVVGLG